MSRTDGTWHPVLAGEGLRTLLVTTSVNDLVADQPHRNPDSGRLLTLERDVPGLPQPRWAGTSSGNGTDT